MTTHMAPTAMSTPVSAVPPMWTAPTVKSAVSAWSKPSLNEVPAPTRSSPKPSTRQAAQNNSCTMSATGPVGAKIAS